MPRQRSQNPFTTVRSEGGLLPPELLQRVVDADRALAGMAPGDYHLGPSERLNERISRSWNRLVGLWASFAPSLAKMEGDGEAGTGPTRERWLLPLFTELDFGRLQPARSEEIDGKSFPVSHRWQSQLPIHLVGGGVDLDHRSAGVAGAAKASPHGLVQELLNRTEALWGIVSNGRLLRLLRDNASLTRQAYVEFDLEAMMAGEIYADFALLFLLLHESRFEAERPAECVLERWVQAARAQGTRVREQLRTGVERAIETLGAGFLAHPANAPLREKLRSGDLSTQDYYRQLLRLVYCLIFLFVAEDRHLLHPPGAPEESMTTYQSYYSSTRLRNLAERRRGTRHPDLFEAVKVVITALGRDEGIAALGLPFLGGYLFAPGACPDLEASCLANVDLLGTVRALAFTVEDKVLRAVDYRNLDSEELGSVYESLLELHPEIDAEAAAFSLTTVAGNERKTTGSYYTPTPLISALLDSALDPVLEQAASKPDPEAALLGLRVLDPACGSGHFLAAAAHRIARRLAAVRTGEDESSPQPYRRALRDVISGCIYGIDLNPMAVELCKVSLWMEAVEPGKPLSFLDHHIVCGNSLLGTTPKLLADGIPEDAFNALEGDDKKVVSELRKRNREERKGQQLFDLGSSPAELVRPVTAAVDALEHLLADSSQAVHEKERLWSQIEHSDALAHAKLLADAWCAAFLIRRERGTPALTDGVLRLLSADSTAGGQALHDEIAALVSTYRFLHPHLAFPGVFRVPLAGEEPENPDTGWSGGFNVVLGNPPWERVELTELDFFASRDRGIASAAGAKRKARIADLANQDPELWNEWQRAQRVAEGENRFLRSSGRYPLCGVGRVNTYAVFAETMRDYLTPEGIMGVVVPTGIATDDTTKAFFADCVDGQRLLSLLGFENEELVFPNVHHAFRFCLLTLDGGTLKAREAKFQFFARKSEDLNDPDRQFELTAEDLSLINPNTRTAPIFRSRVDAELTKKIYRRVPILVRDGFAPANPWSIRFQQGLFNMTSDSHLFRTAVELAGEGAALHGSVWIRGETSWLPLYEAKMMHQFTHRWGDYSLQPPGRTHTELPVVPLQFLHDTDYVVQPRYWVAYRDVVSAIDRPARWLLVFRDITGTEKVRTMIAAALPVAGVGHSLPLLWADAPPPRLAALLGILNSFAFDFVARQKVGGTHMTFYILKQLPVLLPTSLADRASWSVSNSVEQWMASRVLELTYTSSDMAPFAADLGYTGPPFRWDPDRRSRLRAELDAACFHLYGLERNEVEHAMDSFPVVRRREEASQGEYLTKRLILEQYDDMTPR